MESEKAKYPFFARSDLDGFFGLFVDNLVQLLLIVVLCGGLCGMSGDYAFLVYERILPGAAISILLGNLFYAWQARRLAKREGRVDVTALPYGINTPSLLVYVYFVIFPVYRETGNPELAWQMGLLACAGSGVIEFVGAFFAEAVRKFTPRAALLSTLAGIAIGFIAMTFALQIWQQSLIAMLPLAIILITYFAKTRFFLGLPGGFIAIVVGTALAWMLPGEISGHEMRPEAVADGWAARGVFLPYFSGGDLLEALNGGKWLGYLSVIIPMGLFNIIGSLQNIESAEAAGDSYGTAESLSVNGIGTLVAAMLGSCFPTTIYIGHPGWKELGARAGYSSLNGIVILLLCFTGTVSFISSLVPIEACVAIVLWIGVIIVAQAFTATPVRHASAVAIGLFPAIAAWGQTVMMGTFFLVASVAESGSAITVQAVLTGEIPGMGINTQVNGFLVHGMNVIQQGYIFTCMIIAAVSACLIDRKFYRASFWAFLAAVFSFVGLIHAYQVSGNVIDFLFLGMKPREGASVFPAQSLALSYLLMCAVFLLAGLRTKKCAA